MRMGLTYYIKIIDLKLIVYVIAILFLVFTPPLYGHPAIVYWAGKVMRKTGFAYDPVCTDDISSLCVRAPLYYSFLAISENYFKITLAILFIIFVVVQIRLVKSLGIDGGVIGLMWPPIYLLFSRTYVDALTSLLCSALLLFLIKILRMFLDTYYYFLLHFWWPLRERPPSYFHYSWYS